jgi:alcohol dehydrogenase (cytochrome c)
MKRRAQVATVAGLLTLAALIPYALHAQVSSERLLRADEEPQNWLTYSGAYSGHRHSRLKQIDGSNVRDLEVKWIWQARSLQSFSATPLVVDGIMYVTQAPNDVVAIDARTGRTFWMYRYDPSPGRLCCRGLVNRGLAILGDTLFMATVDAHLIAIDTRNGKPLWKTKVAEAADAYGMTLAPLVVKDKVIVGPSGGEYGIRGFIDAYDVKTGKRAWRFHTIPGPGEPGNETWGNNSWEHGGAPAWLTGSYDPELNLTYWGIGNPGPDFNAAQRPGDNLYSDSVVALDVDTGELKWHFQFTPNDPYDYDSTQIPVLVDTTWNGTPRKLMYWANRNGFFYVLDRVTGEFLLGKPFAHVNWASGLDAKGRPIRTPQPPDAPTYPGALGATNWYSPSYSPRTGLLYVSAWENYGGAFGEGEPIAFVPGQNFTGGGLPPPPGTVPMPGMQRGPVNTWHGNNGWGLVIAIDPKTGDRKWTFRMHDVNTSGILTTASDLLFVGGREGYFQALDARTGGLLWRFTIGGETAAGPMAYEVDGRQYIAIAAGHSLFTFGLRER